MSTPSEESLFSLELVVDCLQIPSVACRFPAVAFRLLDFPTLIIHHVEPDLAEIIRRKVEGDAFYDIPPQFSELKDRNGNFQVKKGKSCLYKISPDTLKMHLSNTPLYVMIIDTYPEVPKLIGNCIIPLKNSMDSVYADIVENGTTVPSVHGEKDSYSIYNLMGTEIGIVAMEHRILSLGAALLSHIPEQALTSRTSGAISHSENAEKSVKEKEKIVKTADVIMQELPLPGKKMTMIVSDPEMFIPEEKVTSIEMSTQTHPERRSKKLQTKTDDDMDDIFIVNTFCPPPLFYNSKADESKENTRQHIQYAHEDKPKDTHLNQEKTLVTDEESDFSDTETIRSEDVFQLTPNEKDYFESDQKYFYGNSQKPLVRKTLTKSPVKPQKQGAKQAWSDQKDEGTATDTLPGQQRNQPVLLPGNLPILNALLAEITSFQQHGQQYIPQTDLMPSQPRLVPDEHSSQPPVPWVPAGTLQKHHRPAQGTLGTPRRVPVSSPRRDSHYIHQKQQTQQHPHKHTHECEHAHKDQGVPKNKGWLRQAPVYGQQKSKLTYGLTNTSRLRLAKTNPDLLSTLEKQERKYDAGTVSKQGTVLRREDSIHPAREVDVVTAVGRQGYLSENEADAYQERPESMMSEYRHRKPKPTPRKSLTSNALFSSPAPSGPSRQESPVPSPRMKVKKTRDERERAKENLRMTYDQDKRKLADNIPAMHEIKKTPEETNESSKSEISSQSRSHRSIEIHIPSASLHEDSMASSSATSKVASDLSDQETESPVHIAPSRMISSPGDIEARLRELQEQTEYLRKKKEENLKAFHSEVSQDHASEAEYSEAWESTEEKELQEIKHNSDSESASDGNKSKSEASKSYHSAKSNISKQSLASQVSKQSYTSQGSKIKILAKNPTMSSTSPSVAPRPSIIRRQISRGDSFDSTPSPPRSPKPKPRPGSRSTTPRRKFKRVPRIRQESVHTDSVSSYVPSDPENIHVSQSGGDDYEADFNSDGSDTDIAKAVKPNIPANKLGYTM